MSIITHRFWSLRRFGDNARLREYETKTKLQGDNALHVSCVQIREDEVRLRDIGDFMQGQNISEFTDEENASWLLQQPGDVE